MLAHKRRWNVLNTAKRSSGFSIVELLVGMVILGILMGLAGPSFVSWITNARVRNAAEAALNGIQLAKAEAVRRNTTVRFTLLDTADNSCTPNLAGPNWIVSFDDPTSLCLSASIDNAVDTALAPAPRIIDRYIAPANASEVVLASSQSSISFNGLGRVTPTGATLTVNASNPSAGACSAQNGPIRCMRIDVSSGGRVRMCDPARVLPDPLGC
jgi:type IV fimbrial biogenesis protein FimT